MKLLTIFYPINTFSPIISPNSLFLVVLDLNDLTFEKARCLAIAKEKGGYQAIVGSPNGQIIPEITTAKTLYSPKVRRKAIYKA